jgi:hypothetical protein
VGNYAQLDNLCKVARLNDHPSGKRNLAQRARLERILLSHGHHALIVVMLTLYKKTVSAR